MSIQNSHKARSAIAVFGAAGHTGRFVVRELLDRGITPIAIARNFGAQPAAGDFDPRVQRRLASLDNPNSLDQAIAGARIVINCAGPFLDTADAVMSAALRAGIHYLDVSAEQASTAALLDKFDAAAQRAGIVVIPAMGFYGGFADLLVTATLDDWDHADSIDVIIGLDSWHPTRGTRITGQKNTTPRMVITNGQIAPLRSPPNGKSWEFASPLGPQTMVEVPFSEIVLIARHVRTGELHTYLSSIALGDIRNPATPAPKPVDVTGRSDQSFMVDVVVRQGEAVRRVSTKGRDIYAFTAPLICEAATRLLDGNFSGVGAQAPGTAFNAREFLLALAPEHLTLETATETWSTKDKKDTLSA